MKIGSKLLDGVSINRKNLLINILGVSINWFHGLSWVFFMWEIYILDNHLNILLLAGLFGGIIISMLFCGYLLQKTNKIFEFYISNIILGIVAIIHFSISPTTDIIVFGSLFIMGLLSSGAILAGIKYFILTTSLEERGRVSGFLISLGFLVLLSMLIITIFLKIYYTTIIAGILYVITGGIGLYCRKYMEIKIEKKDLDSYQKFNKKDYFLYFIPLLIMGIIGGVGIFFTLLDPTIVNSIVYVISETLLGHILPITFSIEFIMLIFSFIGIGSGIILGFIGDFQGRKRIWLTSIISGSIGAYILGIIQTEITILLMSISFGLLFTTTAIAVLVTYSDLTAGTKKGDIYLGFVMGFGILGGIMMGALIGFILLQSPVEYFPESPLMYYLVNFFGMFFTSSPVVYFSLTMLMVIIIGYAALFLVKETLPPKEELKWFKCLNHLYVIKSDSGIILFDMPFILTEGDGVCADLVGGGLAGISTLVKEMTSSETKLKIIQQEKANILLEYGTHVIGALIATEELKILHEKLKFFTNEFEIFFKNFLIDWDGNIELFKPTEVIVQRIFELQKFTGI